MAMIECPECKNQISSCAKNCPKCGLPLETVFVCPECGMISIKENKNHCINCGCPFDEKDEEREATSPKKEIIPEQVVMKEDMPEDPDTVFVQGAEEIIMDVLSDYTFTGIGAVDCVFNGGHPINESSETQKARIAFQIPKKDKIFFMVSANVISGFKDNGKGFAITSHGICYCDDKKTRGIIYLDDIVNYKISKSLGYLRLGSFEFNITGVRKVMDMLLDLQNFVYKVSNGRLRAEISAN